MNHFYQEIPGWFSFRPLYEQAVREAENGARFVEVGCWKGRSAAFLGVEIANSKKKIRFDCIDHWRGSAESKHQADPSVRNGTLFQDFLRNVAPLRLHVCETQPCPSRGIHVLRKPSLEAAALYPNRSLDFAFIDASHDYESVRADIRAWWPKIKIGGTLAGDDFSGKGVKKAVLEAFLEPYQVEMVPGTGTGCQWRVRKVLTIVGWLWRDESCRTQYNVEHANTWARMIHRNVKLAHSFVLLTDQPDQPFDPLIQAKTLWNDHKDVRIEAWKAEFPQCWVRIKAFSRGVKKILGERFISIDLDCIVTGSLDPIFSRRENFLICRRAPVRIEDYTNPYQASMWMMDAGSRDHVWANFKGNESLEALKTEGLAPYYLATDQGWMLHELGPNEAGWLMGDGVYHWSWLRAISGSAASVRLPENARIIFFQGKDKPWDLLGSQNCPEWVKDYYQ